MGEAFQGRGLRYDAQLSEAQVDDIRRLLLVAIAQEYTEFERQEAIVVADWPEDAGFDRAVAALKMFSARAAIEAIGDALARIDGGSFGLCVACGRPIPFAVLERSPSTRSCTGCAAASASATPIPK
jgi:RNA polymerase-binding transcription factor DksA